jgi:hypothetical protein
MKMKNGSPKHMRLKNSGVSYNNLRPFAGAIASGRTLRHESVMMARESRARRILSLMAKGDKKTPREIRELRRINPRG